MIHELSRIFKEWLAINYCHTLAEVPKNEHDAALLTDMSDSMRGIYHDRERNTFLITPHGLLRRFFDWCLEPEPQTDDQIRAHMLIIEILMQQVLGSDIGNIQSITQKWYDSHNTAEGEIPAQ